MTSRPCARRSRTPCFGSIAVSARDSGIDLPPVSGPRPPVGGTRGPRGGMDRHRVSRPRLALVSSARHRRRGRDHHRGQILRNDDPRSPRPKWWHTFGPQENRSDFSSTSTAPDQGWIRLVPTPRLLDPGPGFADSLIRGVLRTRDHRPISRPAPNAQVPHSRCRAREADR